MINRSHGHLSLFGLIAIIGVLSATADDAPPIDQPKSLNNYQVDVSPANIGLTISPTSQTEVVGQPRMTKGHPCTQWDQEDIDHMKEMLKTNKELQILFANLKSDMDKVIAKPVDTPVPQKGPDGNWLPPADYFPNHNFDGRFNGDMVNVSNLGTLYVLSGDTKYADYAKQLLLSYAHYSEYGKPPAYNIRFGQGQLGQLLNNQILTLAARGYDLIYNLPSWTAEERKQIHDDLFWPLCAELLYPAWQEQGPDGGSYTTGVNNRGALTSTAVLVSGYATDDQDLVNAALYGIKSTLPHNDKTRYTSSPVPQDWTPGTEEHPYHGLFAIHLDTCIEDDGMWIEGTPTYTLYAACGLITAAEVAWHHGIDFYRYDNCRFKRLFDSLLLLAYPDFTTPALNDSFRCSLYSSYYANTLYEYLYRRYHDPLYLGLIFAPDERQYLSTIDGSVSTVQPTPDKAVSANPDGAKPPASMRNLAVNQIGCPPLSVLYDLAPPPSALPLEHLDGNFFKVGFGILRTKNSSGINNLILSYGPTASHGHPDKLQIDLFAFGDVLMPSPGIQFPYYNNPQLENWYHETVAHNTLTVDEKEQDYFPKKDPHADQVVYGPASTVGLQRAWTDSVYPGVTMDRAVFLTQNYLADLFGAFSASPHKYDLAWHIRGDISSALKFDPMSFTAPIPKGYNFLTNIRQSNAADQPWSLASMYNGHTARLFAAGSYATNVIIADGGLFVDATSDAPHKRPPVPTILERRDNTPSTLYGNALDISDSKDGYIKGVNQEGGLDAGYGLLKVETVNGTDLCFAAYRPGNYNTGGLQTDALQAMVQMNGQGVQTLYLAGGKTLSANGASITRSETGLAYIEKTDTGTYILGNPSPTEATITVKLPELANLKAYSLDDTGNQTGAEPIKSSGPQTYSLFLKANSKVAFTSK